MDIFDYVSMEGVQFGLAALEPPWSFSIGKEQCGVMYLIEQGQCWFEIPTGQCPPLLMEKGSIVALSAGQPHVLRSSLDAPEGSVVGEIPLSGLEARADLKPVSAQGTRIFSARLAVDTESLAGLYPAWAFIPPDDTDAGKLIHALASMAEAEIRKKGGMTGTTAIIRRFAECIVIAILRHLLHTESPSDPSWNASSADRHVARALSLIHENPEVKWSVEKLAKEVGLGRSAFYERFKKLVGKPPVHYHTELRIKKAATAIQQGRLSLGEIAIMIGYESEAAFNRAFQRQVGMTPGRYRTMIKTIPE